jgi:hypothetical protein
MVDTITFVADGSIDSKKHSDRFRSAVRSLFLLVLPLSLVLLFAFVYGMLVIAHSLFANP